MLDSGRWPSLRGYPLKTPGALTARRKVPGQKASEAPSPTAEELAKGILLPTLHAANTLRQWCPMDNHQLDLRALFDALQEQCRLASNGDLKRGEAMLTVQAHTLDAIFNGFARLAQQNIRRHFQVADSCMRLALKAQSQCRTTLDTLAAIKNPNPVAFVRQANIAHGPQQVNNGAQSPETSRARESENQPNKLLERQHRDELDGRATQTAVGADSPVETVGKVHRPADSGGESHRSR